MGGQMFSSAAEWRAAAAVGVVPERASVVDQVSGGGMGPVLVPHSGRQRLEGWVVGGKAYLAVMEPGRVRGGISAELVLLAPWADRWRVVEHLADVERLLGATRKRAKMHGVLATMMP